MDDTSTVVGASAEEIAKEFKEHSVAEFFKKICKCSD